MKLNQRYLQKLKTRSTLISASLKLMGEEKGLGELSLREVAGAAGIVPAAFYRHFKNMEELGLAVVDDMGGKLRTLLRDARKSGAYRAALKESLDLFFEYVNKNRLLFRFLSREKTGGNQRIRKAIRNEMAFIGSELAADMRMPKSIPFSDIEFVSEMIVSNAFHMAGEYLDVDLSDEREHRRIQIKTVKQLRLIFVGGIRARRRRKNISASI
ncbi:MAG: HTH-type transcriptional repressor FabR [Leptospira sp.]|nr:HTH-type transcriptional repressor FabR [Leptospira sp.]